MTNKGFAFAGAGALVVGLFTPIVTVPFLGSINLFNNGTNLVALALMALAAIAAGLALKDREADVIFPGIGAALLLGYHFIATQIAFANARSQLAESMKDNPFAGMAQSAMGSVQLQWGWIVLAIGAGLLIFSALKERKAAGAGVIAIENQPSRSVAIICGLLVVGLIVWDVVKRNQMDQSVPSSAAGGTGLSSVDAGVEVESKGPSQEESVYIRQHLNLYDLETKYYDSMLDGNVPGVDFKIKNNGPRTLNQVTVRVVFLDASEKPIAEQEYNPVFVSEYGFGDNNTPLRPNYIWQNEADRFYTAKSVPSEWAEGKATATITEIEFAPN